MDFKTAGLILLILPHLLSAYLLLWPPLVVILLVSATRSVSIAGVFTLLVCHATAMMYTPMYFQFWKLTARPARAFYTSLLLWFLGELEAVAHIPNMYADIGSFSSLSSFYDAQSKGVRKRMCKQTVKDVKKSGIVVTTRSADCITWEHLLVQWSHGKRLESKPYDMMNLIQGALLIHGTLTEYRWPDGSLASFGLSVVKGESLTVFMYAAGSESAKTGLWFYNVYINIARAIECKGIRYVNATMANHKPEAKKGAGFVMCVDNEINRAAWGGRGWNDPARALDELYAPCGLH